MKNGYRPFFFGPRFSFSKFRISERLTKTRPPTVAVLSRPRFINSLIDALETSRSRAASACEIKSSMISLFFFVGTHNYLYIVRIIAIIILTTSRSIDKGTDK